MIAVEQNLFHSFLTTHDEKQWSRIVKNLLPLIHPVDQGAASIWFSFWPLKLSQSLQRAGDPDQAVKKLKLDGNYRLQAPMDSSVQFLFGSRYWSTIKKAVLEHAESSFRPENSPLETQICEIAGKVAACQRVMESLVLGITAVGVMMLQQVGVAVFAASVNRSPKVGQGPPVDELMKARNKGDGSGLFGFLHLSDRKYTVTFDENHPDCTFKAFRGQDLSMAAASDHRDYKSRDRRRIEGPIPCECRSGACGYCWIGILHGKENVSEITKFEKKRLQYFGYASNEMDSEKHPLIRLACQSKCYGNVTIVIPPWNGALDGR